MLNMLTSRSEIEREKKKIFILEPVKCKHFWIRGSMCVLNVYLLIKK